MTRNDAWCMAAKVADSLDVSDVDFAEQILAAMSTDDMVDYLRFIARVWNIDVSEWSEND